VGEREKKERWFKNYNQKNIKKKKSKKGRLYIYFIKLELIYFQKKHYIHRRLSP
jgi:hypothetical protein